jgi:DNA-binding NtrC family response regulator
VTKPFHGKRVLVWGGAMCDASLVGEALARLGCEVRTLKTLEALRECWQSGPADLLVARLCAGARNELDDLRELRARPAFPPLLVVADSESVGLYLEAMQHGAFDCIGLPLDACELERIVQTAFDRQAKDTAAAFNTGGLP